MQQHERTFYELITIIGLATTYVMWSLWQEILLIISQFDLQQAVPAIVGFFLTLGILATLVSCIGVFFAHKNTLLIIFAIWSLPLLLHNEIVSLGVVWVLLFIINCILATWIIHNQSELFIRPAMYRVIPGSIKIWFLLFSMLLAGTIIMHPTIRTSNFEVEIPQNLWNTLWDVIDIDVIGEQVITNDVQSQNFVSDQQLSQTLTGNGSISIESLKELLSEYGLDIQEGQSFDNTEIQSPSSYFESLEGDISHSIKEQTESLANDFIAPFESYLPYIIGFTFFISAQIITPLLGYVTYLVVEILFKTLLKLNIIKLVDEERMTQHYVLQ